jgi:hypothetical protein
MPNFRPFCWLLVCLGNLLPLAAVLAQKGQVTDPTGDPLAFVSVIVLDRQNERKVVFTDIDGQFVLPPTPAGLASVSFRYVGFDDEKLTKKELDQLAKKGLKVVMRPSDLSLGAVDIFAGENPADILMRKVIANRHRNNPEREGSYRCKTYNKVALDAVPNRAVYTKKHHKEKQLRAFDKAEADALLRHLFFMESVTERQYLAPNFVQEKVLLNRVSGFQDAALVTLANAVQPFSFYGDFVPLMEKKFVNPVSPGSTKLYYFSMKDTLFVGTDTVWVVGFKPRKGKVFRALKGTLHIHSNQFAVQNVIAQPAFGNENLNMTIEQAYTFVPVKNGDPTGQWFPQQLNFEIRVADYPVPGLGMKATGHSYISEADPHCGLKMKDFNPEQPLYIDDNAFRRDSNVWAKWQQFQPLSNKERSTYSFLDSLGADKHFDRYSKVVSALSTGIWHLKNGIGLDLPAFIKLNEYEKFRLGVGFTNAQHKPLGLTKRFQWGAGAGYGIKDKAMKYNAYGLWRIHRGWQTQLGFLVQRDLLEPGAPYEMSNTAFINRSLYAKRMDRADEAALRFFTRVGKTLTTSVTVRHQRLTPAGYQYSYVANETAMPTSQFNLTEMTGAVRFAYGELLRKFMGENNTVQRWPVVEVAATTSLYGPFKYQRYLGAIYQSVFVPRLGYLQWRLEGGWANGDLPLTRLFTLNQNSNGGYSALAVRQTFQSLPDTLFLHDRFANLFIEQEFGPIFYQKKYSAPFLTIIQNASIGYLANPERHRDLGFLVMETPYLETGVRIDNILRIRYVRLGWIGVGAAAFYRWGAYSDLDWRKNVAPRVAFKFTL